MNAIHFISVECRDMTPPNGIYDCAYLSGSYSCNQKVDYKNGYEGKDICPASCGTCSKYTSFF